MKYEANVVEFRFTDKYLMINMDAPVEGYEKYDFHKGMSCKIDGFPFTLMAENGELSLEAGAVYLSAHGYKQEDVKKFNAGDVIEILELRNNEKPEIYCIKLPERIHQQSFNIIK